jgi:NAD(P)H-dependent flavin oxidoreductase YrpB (nitropropane dioxygenase family)
MFFTANIYNLGITSYLMAFQNIPPIKIGTSSISLVQGGMGVGISLSGLASAIMNEDGLGVIAGVGLGEEKGYIKKYAYDEANQRALRQEIRKARVLSEGKGLLGVNIMHVLSDYSSLVKAAVEENVDVIISGAGIPRDLPSYLIGGKTMIVPIVSSARLADLLCKTWLRQGHAPDAIIVEGPMAGGHLGYSLEELKNQEFVKHGLEKIIVDVISTVKPYEEKVGRKIPVIAAGGIFYGGDIKKFLKLGATGVQMATRFVTTYECDASLEFKQAYINCKKEDLTIINSPVGMPGRAIINEFLKRVEKGETVPIDCPYHCLKTCNPRESPYCIARALLEARKGIFEKGYVFAGANAWRCDKLTSVKQVFEDLDREYLEEKTSDSI